MKKLFTILCLILFANVSYSQIVISGYMYDVSGSDGNYEYVQLMATENINFATNNYTVAVCNNSTAESKGWLIGGTFKSYTFVLSTGSVNKGDIFYVGGSEKRLVGAGSADISSATWIRTIDLVNNAGDVVGNSGNGKFGNGGSSADGIAVFSGKLLTTDTTKKPIDCVFYGTAVGNAFVSSTVGFPVADNDLYKSSQGLFGEGTNTTIFNDYSSNRFTSLTGTYDAGTKKWTTARTATSITLSGSSIIGDIASKITLKTGGPAITLNTVGFTNDFGLTYPNTPSSGSNFLFSGDKLTDSLVITVKAPFEIRVGVNSYASGTIKRVHTAGVVNNTVLDVRFNPTATGVFMDTIFLSTTGGTTQKVPVKGTSSNNPEISFQTTSFSINEGGGGSITLQVNIANANANSTSVDIDVTLLSTATAGSDYTFSPPETITFPANSTDSIIVTIPIIDDNIVEGDEIIWFTFDNSNNGAVFGANDTVRVTIIDDDYRKVNIGDIAGEDANGEPDSVGKLYEITGVVYGHNKRSPGFQFTIRDQTGGLGTFGPTDAFGYTPAQGDSITILGQLSHFRGFAQISFMDTIIFHQSNQPLKAPRVVTTLGEGTESDLVRFDNATASGVWASGNQWVYINGGNDSISVRITPSSNTLIGKPIPSKPFALIGIGGQFDFSSPYTSGYQVFPRDTNDIIVPKDSLSPFNLLSPTNNSSITIQGAGTQLLSITWEPSQQGQGLLPPTYEFLMDIPTGDFSAPIFSRPSSTGGSAAALGLPYFQIATFLDNQGVNVGQSISLIWTVKATTTNSHSRLSDMPFNITLIRDAMNSVKVVLGDKLLVYPNPATNTVFVEAPEAIKSIAIASLDGKIQTQQIVNGTLKADINTTNLKSGMYVISVETGNAVYTHRLIIQK